MTIRIAALLPALLLSGTFRASYSFNSPSSEATGDLDANAPFGLPPSEFKDATSSPNASTAYPIAGYNVSVPAGQDPGGNGNMIAGWQLSAAVAADVALADADGDDLPDAADRSLFTDATTLSIHPPGGLRVDDEAWRMCAVVYTGLAGDAAAATSTSTSAAELDGTCAAVLQSECTRQLQVAMTYGGITKDGGCSSPGVPVKCQGQFPKGVNGTAFALSSSTVSRNRFYAFGAPPTSRGNSTALEEATQNIWPVILAWGHLAENGDFQAVTAYLHCVRASNTSSSGGGGGDATPSAGVPSSTPNGGTKKLGSGSRWAFAFAVAMALWLLDVGL